MLFLWLVLIQLVVFVALIYGIAATEIRDANPGVDFTKLRPGDSIFIPPSLNAR